MLRVSLRITQKIQEEKDSPNIKMNRLSQRYSKSKAKIREKINIRNANSKKATKMKYKMEMKKLDKSRESIQR